MTDFWDDGFAPSTAARNTLHWALDNGATTLADAYDLLEQLAFGNDVPQVLGEEATVEEVREELEHGLEVAGPDASLTDLL